MDTYGKLCTEFYDLSKPEAPADALEFYLRHLDNTDGPVLEPMCGSGRWNYHVSTVTLSFLPAPSVSSPIPETPQKACRGFTGTFYPAASLYSKSRPHSHNRKPPASGMSGV